MTRSPISRTTKSWSWWRPRFALNARPASPASRGRRQSRPARRTHGRMDYKDTDTHARRAIQCCGPARLINVPRTAVGAAGNLGYEGFVPAAPARRHFLTRSLSLGGLALLTGCDATGERIPGEPWSVPSSAPGIAALSKSVHRKSLSEHRDSLDHKSAQGQPAHVGLRAQDHILQGSGDAWTEQGGRNYDQGPSRRSDNALRIRPEGTFSASAQLPVELDLDSAHRVTAISDS